VSNQPLDEGVRIAARLRAGAPDARVIVFTAGAREEGAGAVARAVAMAYARMDAGPILLIDADLRAPRAHAWFGVAPQPGLADCLRGAATLDTAARASGIDRLSIVPAGAENADATALLTGAALPRLIGEARARFACTIIDAPLLGESAAAAVVAAISDGVVLVVRAGVHSHTELTDMRRELLALRKPLLGCVLSIPGE